MPSRSKGSLSDIPKVSILEDEARRSSRRSSSLVKPGTNMIVEVKENISREKSDKIAVSRGKSGGPYRDVYESTNSELKRKMTLTKEYRFQKVQAEFVKERRSRRQSQRQLTNRRFPVVDARNAHLMEDSYNCSSDVQDLVNSERARYKSDKTYLLTLVNELRVQNGRIPVTDGDQLAHLIAADMASRPFQRGLLETKLVSPAHDLDSGVMAIQKQDGLFGSRSHPPSKIVKTSSIDRGSVVFLPGSERGCLGVVSSVRSSEIIVDLLPQFKVQSDFPRVLHNVTVGTERTVTVEYTKTKVMVMHNLILYQNCLHLASNNVHHSLLRLHDRTLVPCPDVLPHTVPDLHAHLKSSKISEALAVVEALFLIEKVSFFGLSPCSLFARALARRANLFRVLNDVYSDIRVLSEGNIPLVENDVSCHEHVVAADQVYHAQMSSWRALMLKTNSGVELRSSVIDEPDIPNTYHASVLIRVFAVLCEEMDCHTAVPQLPLFSSIAVYDLKKKTWAPSKVLSLNAQSRRVALQQDTGLVSWVSWAQCVCSPYPSHAQESSGYKRLLSSLYNAVHMYSHNEVNLVLSADWSRKGQIPQIQIDRRMDSKKHVQTDPKPYLDDSDFEDQLTEPVLRAFVDEHRSHSYPAEFTECDLPFADHTLYRAEDQPYHERYGLTQKQLRNRFKRVRKALRQSDNVCFCCDFSLKLDQVHGTVMCMGRDGPAPLRAGELTRCVRCGNQAHSACYNQYKEEMEDHTLKTAKQIHSELVYVKNLLIATVVRAHYDFSRLRVSTHPSTIFNNAMDKVPLNVRMCVVKLSGEAPPSIEDIVSKIRVEPKDETRCAECSRCEVCHEPGMIGLLVCSVCHTHVHAHCADEEVKPGAKDWICGNCFSCRDCDAHCTSSNANSGILQVNKFLSSLFVIAAPYLTIKLPSTALLRFATGSKTSKPVHNTVLEFINDTSLNVNSGAHILIEESIVSPDYQLQAKSLASALRYSAVPYITHKDRTLCNIVPRYTQEYFSNSSYNLVALSEVITIGDFLLSNAIAEINDCALPRTSYVCKKTDLSELVIFDDCMTDDASHTISSSCDDLLSVPSHTDVPSGDLMVDDSVFAEYKSELSAASVNQQLSPGLSLLTTTAYLIRKPQGSLTSLYFSRHDGVLCAKNDKNGEYAVPVYTAQARTVPGSTYPVHMLGASEAERFLNRFVQSSQSYSVPSPQLNFSAYVLRYYTPPSLPPPPPPPISEASGAPSLPVSAVILGLGAKTVTPCTTLSQKLNRLFSCEINLLDPQPNSPLECTGYFDSQIHAVTQSYTSQIKNYHLEPYEEDFGYMLCRRCALQSHDGKECPQCCHGWFEDVTVEMIECSTCCRWVHSRCDSIDDGKMEQANNSAVQYDCRECLLRRRMALLVRVLNALEDFDTNEFFHSDVDDAQLPGYRDVIKIPMSFDTVRSKLLQLQYTTVDDMRYDQNLLCRNAREYNGDDSIVTQTARQLQLKAAPLLRFVENSSLRDIAEERGVLIGASSEKKSHAFKTALAHLDMLCSQTLQSPSSAASVTKMHPDDFVHTLLPSLGLKVVGPGFQLDELRLVRSPDFGKVWFPKFRQLLASIARSKSLSAPASAKRLVSTGTLLDYAMQARSATRKPAMLRLQFPRHGAVVVPADPCVLCGSSCDEEHLLKCTDCGTRSHSYCVAPHCMQPSSHTFKCDDCAKCSDCKECFFSQETLDVPVPAKVQSIRQQLHIQDAQIHSVGLPAPPAVLHHTPTEPLVFPALPSTVETVQIMRCRDCLNAFHPSCLPQWALESAAASLFFVCPQCLCCLSCKSTQSTNLHKDPSTRDSVINLLTKMYPNSNIYPLVRELCEVNNTPNTFIAKWDMAKRLCPVCSLLIANGHSCGLCHESYAGSSSNTMALCDCCNNWVHLACENVTDEALSAQSYFLCSHCRLPDTPAVPVETATQPVLRIDPARCHLPTLASDAAEYLCGNFYRTPLMRARVSLATPRTTVIGRQRKLTLSFHSQDTSLHSEHFGTTSLSNKYACERNRSVIWSLPVPMLTYRAYDGQQFDATPRLVSSCFVNDPREIIPVHPTLVAYGAALARGTVSVESKQTVQFLKQHIQQYDFPQSLDQLYIYSAWCPPLLSPISSLSRVAPVTPMSTNLLYNPLFFDYTRRYDCAGNFKFNFLLECPPGQNLKESSAVMEALLNTSNPLDIEEPVHSDERSSMIKPWLVSTVLASTAPRSSIESSSIVKQEMLLKIEEAVEAVSLKRRVADEPVSSDLNCVPTPSRRRPRAQPSHAMFPQATMQSLGMCVPAPILAVQTVPLLKPRHFSLHRPSLCTTTNNGSITSLKTGVEPMIDDEQPAKYLTYDFESKKWLLTSKLGYVYTRDASQLQCNMHVRAKMRSLIRPVYTEDVLQVESRYSVNCHFSSVSSNLLSLLATPQLPFSIAAEETDAVQYSSDNISCVLCSMDRNEALGRLLPVGTLPAAFYNQSLTGFHSAFAHEQCLQWCFHTQPEVSSDDNDASVKFNWSSPLPVLASSTPIAVHNVHAAITATHTVVCTYCGLPGASVPCCGIEGEGTCGHVMHLPCALLHQFSFFRINMQRSERILSTKLTFCPTHFDQVTMYMPSDTSPSTSIYQFAVDGAYPARIVVPSEHKNDFKTHSNIATCPVNRSPALLLPTMKSIDPPVEDTEYIFDTTGLDSSALGAFSTFDTSHSHTVGTQIGSLVVRSLGQVLPLHSAFHTATSIIPYGYCGVNQLPSLTDASQRSTFVQSVGAVQDTEAFNATVNALHVLQEATNWQSEITPQLALFVLQSMGRIRSSRMSNGMSLVSPHLRQKASHLSLFGNEADTHSLLSKLNDLQVSIRVAVKGNMPIMTAAQWKLNYAQYVSIDYIPRQTWIPLYSVKVNDSQPLCSTSLATVYKGLKAIAEQNNVDWAVSASDLAVHLGLLHPVIQSYHQTNPLSSALLRYGRESGLRSSTSLTMNTAHNSNLDSSHPLLRLFGASPGSLAQLGLLSRHAVRHDVTAQAMFATPEILKDMYTAVVRSKTVLPKYSLTAMEDSLFHGDKKERLKMDDGGSNDDDEKHADESNLVDIRLGAIHPASGNNYNYWTQHVSLDDLPVVSSVLTTGRLSYSDQVIYSNVLKALEKIKGAEALLKILSQIQLPKNHVTRDRSKADCLRLILYAHADVVDCAATQPTFFNFRGALQLGLDRYEFTHQNHRGCVGDAFAHEASQYTHKGTGPKWPISWTRSNTRSQLSYSPTVLPGHSVNNFHGIATAARVTSTLLHGHNAIKNTPIALLSQYTAPLFVTTCRVEHQFGSSASSFYRFMMPKWFADTVAGKRLALNTDMAAMYIKHDDTSVVLDSTQTNITGQLRIFEPRLYSPLDKLRPLYTQYQLLLNLPDYAAPMAGHSVIHMWGLFTTRPYSKDQMIIEYQGELLQHPMPDWREVRYEAMDIDSCYMFMVTNRLYVDSTRKGNASRFVNHSCDPSCYTQILDGKIVIFAKQDIDAGVELTYDYCFSTEDERITCTCGSEKCSGRLN